MQINAIRIQQPGGPDVMRVQRIELPEPGPGQVQVRHEAVGTIEALGSGVGGLATGDRVAYCSALGTYADAANVPAERIVKLPAGVDCDAAAAVLLKGLTVQYLFRQTHVLKPGETILFHAAAGGVGLIACQWARHLGITMIGTASSEAKGELALAHGCTHIIDYTREDVAARVVELTHGKKVPVVYDGVGKDTFMASLDSLAPRGLLVSFGNASGPVTGVDLGILAAKGSLYVTRPTLATYTATREMLQSASDELFDLVARGAIKPDITARYPLGEAVRAHRDLEGRRTTGSILLKP
jgi:NADPH2:quinone reductase